MRGTDNNGEDTERWDPSLRWRLGALVLFCVIPAAVAGALLIFHDYRTSTAALLEQTLGTTRALASVVDRQFSEVRAGLEGLATSPLLRSRDYAGFHHQARAFADSGRGMNVVVLEPGGGQVVNTLKPFGEALPSGGEPAALMAVFRTGKPAVTGLFTGRVRQQGVLAVGVPVVQDGQVVLTVNAGVDPAQLQAILQRQELPARWVATIVDQHGTVVARTADPARYVGHRARLQLLSQLAIHPQGTFEGITQEGTPVVTAFTRSAATGWGVAISIPKEVLTQPLERALSVLAAAFVVLLLVGLWVASRFATGIVHSIEALLSAATQLGRGERVQLGRLAFHEANQLGHALAHTGRTLQVANRDVVQSEALLRVVLESARDAIVVVDEGYRIVQFNESAIRLFRHYREEVLGAGLQELFEPRCYAELMRRLERARSGPAYVEATPVAFSAMTREDRTVPVWVAIAVAQPGAGGYFALIVRDQAPEPVPA